MNIIVLRHAPRAARTAGLKPPFVDFTMPFVISIASFVERSRQMTGGVTPHQASPSAVCVEFEFGVAASIAAASLAASLCQQFAIGTLWADSASSIISSTEADPHAIRRTPRTCEAQRFQSNQPFESAPMYFRGYTCRTSEPPS